MTILLRASTVNAREMNNAKISSVDLKHSKSVEILSLLQEHSQKVLYKNKHFIQFSSINYAVKYKCPANYGGDYIKTNYTESNHML